MKRHHKEETTSEGQPNQIQEEVPDLRDHLGGKKQRRNQTKAIHDKMSTKTEEEWTELEAAKVDESYDWREHQWPYLIAKSEGNLLYILLDCHKENGKTCQLDTLLDKKSLERSSTAKKVNYVEYPEIALTQPLESYIEVLPSEKIPDEWVLAGATRERGPVNQEETQAVK